MKHKITIPKPCAENWDTMSSAERGRHCAVCDKVVHDFTDFTKPDLYKFLEENKGVCGRVPVKLLDIPTVKERSSYAATIALATVLSVSAVTAQNREDRKDFGEVRKVLVLGEPTIEISSQEQIVVKGKVVDSRGFLGLPGASVFLLSHSERGIMITANINGEFEFIVPEDIDVSDVMLRISFMGYEDADVRIDKANLNLEVILRESTEVIGEVMYSVGKAKVKKEKKSKSKRKDKW